MSASVKLNICEREGKRESEQGAFKGERFILHLPVELSECVKPRPLGPSRTEECQIHIPQLCHEYKRQPLTPFFLWDGDYDSGQLRMLSGCSVPERVTVLFQKKINLKEKQRLFECAKKSRID